MTVTVGKQELEQVVQLLVGALVSPQFSQRALDEVRTGIIAEIRSTRPGPRHAAQLVRERLHGAGHPYGRSIRGSVDSLTRIIREDVLLLHRAVYVPQNVTFVFAGDIDAVSARRMLDNQLGSWRNPVAPTPPPSAISAAEPRPGILLLDAPDLQQASIAIGLELPGVDSRDWPAAQIVSRTCAGVYSSRLSRTLRQEKGVTYSVGANLSRRLGRSELVMGMSVSLPATAATISDILHTLSNLASSPPDGTELLRIRNTLVFDAAWDLDTTAGTASLLHILASQRLPTDWLARGIASWADVRVADLRRVAERYFDPARAVIVIEGPANVIEPQLRAGGIAFERLP